MANSIDLITKYVPILDEVYKETAKSSVLDAPANLVRETEDAKEVKIAKMVLDGLADYDRNGGFVGGDATLTWQTHEFTQDRGRSFSIDSMDNQETANIAYGSLAGEFLRVHVAPEVDAYRFSQYAALAGNSDDDVITPENVLEAIDAGVQEMDDAEVPEEGRILFVSPTVFNALKQADGIQRRLDVLESDGDVNRKIMMLDEMQIIKVPQGRFNTEITQADGTTGGQEAGGFTATGDAINFMIIHPSAVIQIAKHAVPRVFAPNVNQAADAWKYDYRIYHDAWVLDNKVDGIYLNTVTA